MALQPTIYHLKGDIVSPVVSAAGTRVLFHLGNDRQVWGRSELTKALDKRWPVHGESFVRSLPVYGSYFATRPEPTIVICSVYALRTNPDTGVGQFDNALFRQGMDELIDACYAGRFNSYTGQITYHMPRIGAGTSSGDTSAIEEIVAETVARYWPVFVYSR